MMLSLLSSLTTSDMNTPEHTTKVDDRLQVQFIQNQTHRLQGRDYGRILREYNTPALWYRPSPITRSIYYYDPNYQKYLQQQQQPKFSTNIRFNPSPTRVTNPSKLRHTKCTPNSHHFSNQQQKQKLPSRLQSVPKLPPIIIQKKTNDE